MTKVPRTGLYLWRLRSAYRDADPGHRVDAAELTIDDEQCNAVNRRDEARENQRVVFVGRTCALLHDERVDKRLERAALSCCRFAPAASAPRR